VWQGVIPLTPGGADAESRLAPMSDGGRDFAKGAILTLIPTGLGFILSGWIVGVICLFVAGGLSLVLWTPFGNWLGFHPQTEAPPREPPLRPGDLARRARYPSEPSNPVPGRIYGGAAVGTFLRRQEHEDERKAIFLAVEAEIALAHEEAFEMAKMIRAEWPHKTPESIVVELALPEWRTKLIDFIGAVLGSAQRSAFRGAATGSNVLERLESEGVFLSELALKLTQESVRANEDETLAAKRVRRDNNSLSFLKYDHSRLPSAPEKSSDSLAPLATQLDSLMRSGIDLLAELSVPAQPTVTNGVLRIDGEEAPDEWQEKADAFHQEIRSLLTARHPALLSVFAEGFNGHFRKKQENQEARKRHPAPDRRSTTEKVLDMATFERSGPASTVEASLDGLAAARRDLND
jgi:hypothetical protein